MTNATVPQQWALIPLELKSMSTELDVLEQCSPRTGSRDRERGSWVWSGTRSLFLLLKAIIVYCALTGFSVTHTHTWADQNHMCVCGLAAEELPLARILQRARCMLKQFFPTLLAEATPLPHTAYFPWVSRSDMTCTTVLLWTLSNGTLFFQRPSLKVCFSTRHQGGMEPIQK